MAIVLGANRYGKAETRLFRINRDTERHTVRDLNVSSSLTGDFGAAHLDGDQANVLPTDTQKNTVFAFAKSIGVGEIEEFGLALARHFVDDVEPVTGADVRIEEYAWERIPVDAEGHDHAFTKAGQEVRTTEVVVDATGSHVVSGLKDLVVLKSTGSEFAGFLVDEYTTLPETHDRVLATALTARWTLCRRRPSTASTGRRLGPRSGPPCWSGSPTCTRWRCSSRCGRWAGRARSSSPR